MRLDEFIECFRHLEREDFLERFDHPFLLQTMAQVTSPSARQVFLVRGVRGAPLVVGRGARCHVPVRDRLVSTKHAELLVPEQDGQPWRIVDRGSTNGTTIAGERVEPDVAYALESGTIIGLGPSAEFEFLSAPRFLERVPALGDPSAAPASDDTEPVQLTVHRGVVARSAGRAAAAEELAPQLLAFCDTLDPVPLERGRALVIGRKADTAELVIPHPHVSRRHAAIVWRSDGVFVRDLGSANGTFLLDQRLSEDWTPLPLGQAITIGPHHVYVGGPQSAASSTGGPSGETVLVGERAREGFRGRLEDTTLRDVLTQIEEERHTGLLEIKAEGIDGTLTFADGAPREATTSDGREGVAAIRRLLRERSGSFTLRPARDVGPRRIDLAFSEILVDELLDG